jgi:hypothetical protein
MVSCHSSISGPTESSSLEVGIVESWNHGSILRGGLAMCIPCYRIGGQQLQEPARECCAETV